MYMCMYIYLCAVRAGSRPLRCLHAHQLWVPVLRMPSRRASDALASGVHVSSEHRDAHIALVERAAALAGLVVGGTHEHELALVVERGGAHDAEAR